MANTLIVTPEKRIEFLNELRTIPNVVRASRKIGVTRKSMYDIYRAEPDFQKEWDEALKEGVESLEAEVHRRAFEGYPGRPVVSNGQVISEITEYDTTLSIFLLKAHAPEKYRDNTRMELTGADGGPVQIDNGEAATELAAILAGIKARKDDCSDLA